MTRAAGRWKTIPFDELGFFHHTSTDLGTGAVYRTYGVHAIPDGMNVPKRWSETVLDGFGRPLQVYQTHFDGLTYTQELQPETSFVDGVNPSTTTRTRRDFGDSSMVSERAEFDGFGSTWRTIRHPDSTTPATTTYAYDVAGNLVADVADVATYPREGVDEPSVYRT